jgi:hypothetical protein
MMWRSGARSGNSKSIWCVASLTASAPSAGKTSRGSGSKVRWRKLNSRCANWRGWKPRVARTARQAAPSQAATGASGHCGLSYPADLFNRGSAKGAWRAGKQRPLAGASAGAGDNASSLTLAHRLARARRTECHAHLHHVPRKMGRRRQFQSQQRVFRLGRGAGARLASPSDLSGLGLGGSRLSLPDGGHLPMGPSATARQIRRLFSAQRSQARQDHSHAWLEPFGRDAGDPSHPQPLCLRT